MIEEKTKVHNHRYELVGPDGRVHGPFASKAKAIDEAFWKWPGIEQDEDETGAGWNIRLAGCQ